MLYLYLENCIYVCYRLIITWYKCIKNSKIKFFGFFYFKQCKKKGKNYE